MQKKSNMSPEPINYLLSESDAYSIAEDLDAIIDAYPDLHPTQVLCCLQSVVIARIRQFRDAPP